MTALGIIGLCIGVFVVGFIAGMILYFNIVHKSGILHINVDDHPDKDLYRLEVTDDLNALPYKKYIIFRIINHE